MPKMWRNFVDDFSEEADAEWTLKNSTPPTGWDVVGWKQPLPYHWLELPKLQFLTCLSQQNLCFSRQNVRWNKNMFVVKDMYMLLSRQNLDKLLFRQKSGQTFVATRPGQTFLATKIVVVSASANDASPVLLGERILRPVVVEVTSLALRVTSIEGC